MKVSFEFFPPKSDQGLKNLGLQQEALSVLKPEYFSITYGAGGSTRDRTLQTVRETQMTFNVRTAPHLSCIGDSEADLLELLDLYKAEGIDKIVALRGDLPAGFSPEANGLKYAVDLIKLIRRHSAQHFDISVAAYPEIHPQASSAAQDFNNFKAKIEAGATEAITQYFFNADAYEDFLNRAQKNGINIPITAGIMPITNYEKLARFSNLCGAEIPRWLQLKLADYANEQDMDSLKAFGIDFISQLCQRLLSIGAPGLHFYTLNQAQPTLAIVNNLGLANS